MLSVNIPSVVFRRMKQHCSILAQNPCIKETKVTVCKRVWIVLSIITYVFDTGTDIEVSIKHYKGGNLSYFVLTVFFIVFPAVVMTVFNVHFYMHDKLNSDGSHQRASRAQRLIRIIFSALLMAPVARNCEALYYAVKGCTKGVTEDEKKHYAERMIFENTDASLLRLFEASLECAPQLILQIYIVAQSQYNKPADISEIDVLQLVSIFSSLLSMAWAIVSYVLSLRASLDFKSELSFSSTVFLFLWRFCEIIARVVALSLFATVFLQYFFLINIIHCFFMFVWVLKMETDLCGNKYLEIVFNFVISFMFIFCFFNPSEDNTRKYSIIYYFVTCVENAILIIVWYHYCSADFSFRLSALIIVFACFTLAIIIMVFYYGLLHPAKGLIQKIFLIS